MVVVDKWLTRSGLNTWSSIQRIYAYHQKCPDGVVDEDGGRCDEHAEAYKAVELRHC